MTEEFLLCVVDKDNNTEIDKLKEELEQVLEVKFHKMLLGAAMQNLNDINNSLRFNNFAYALRELLRNVFAYHSPDKEVLMCSWYKKETEKENQVSRKQRIFYLMHGGVPRDVFSKELLLDIDTSAKLVISHIDSLSKFTHIGPETFDLKDSEIHTNVPDVLAAVLDIFGLIAKCRDEIRSYLHEYLYDAVLKVLTENVYDDLDNKSTHSIVDDVTMESFMIVGIDESNVYLEGEGSVGFELQYGSGSDVEKGDGDVGSCSFPFTFTGKASTSDLGEIDISPNDIDIDDSSWYE